MEFFFSFGGRGRESRYLNKYGTTGQFFFKKLTLIYEKNNSPGILTSLKVKKKKNYERSEAQNESKKRKI